MSDIKAIKARHEAWDGASECNDATKQCHADRATLLSALAASEARAEAAEERVRELTMAAKDVLAERERQKSVEGWLTYHDDKHKFGEMAIAAACYATQGDPEPRRAYSLDEDEAGNPTRPEPPPAWPWSADWWKPKDNRRNLVRAGALILAEIERLDRTLKGAPDGR